MKQNTMSKEDRKMLNSIFWRSMFLSSGRCGGQVRMHAVGFINSILPALRRYPRPAGFLPRAGQKNA